MANTFTAANGKTYTFNADGTVVVGGNSAPAAAAATQQTSGIPAMSAADTYQYSVQQPVYTNQYEEQIKKNLAEVLNRPEFNYNYESDPSYNAYAKQYLAEGDRAQRNAIAQSARYSGGLPNSWSTTAAAQAGNYYASQLAGKIPELEQQAYQRYLDAIGLNVQDVNLLSQQEQIDYAKYLESLGQWNTDRNYNYGAYRDNVSDAQWQSEYQRALANDATANSQWQSEYDRALTNDERDYLLYLDELEYQRGRDAQSDADNLLKTNPLAYWQQAYADAQARGDQSGMTYAHAMAEAYRAELGYSGGVDGSQYIPLQTSSGGSGNSGSTGVSSGGYSGGAGNGSSQNIFEIAKSSGNPEAWIRQNAKTYGFTTAAERERLWEQYQEWDSNNSSKGGGLSLNDLSNAAKSLITAIPGELTVPEQMQFINGAVARGVITAEDAKQIKIYLYGD